MLIELVGPAGVGKSTLRHELLARWPTVDPDADRTLPYLGREERTGTSLARVARSALLVGRHPAWLVAALRDPAGTPLRKRLRWTAHMCASNRSSRRVRAHSGSAVIEFGAMKCLVSAAGAVSVDWVRRRAAMVELADVTVLLEAEPAVLADRVWARGEYWHGLSRAARAAEAAAYYQAVHSLLPHLNTRVLVRNTQQQAPDELAESILAELHLAELPLAGRSLVREPTSRS